MGEKASTNEHDYMPTTKMRQFVQVLLSDEVKGNKTEAERRTGVGRDRFYYYWKSSEQFREWYAQECDNYLARDESLVSSKLIAQVKKGDVQAIKLYYELRGKTKALVVDASTHLHLTKTNEDAPIGQRIRDFTTQLSEANK